MNEGGTAMYVALCRMAGGDFLFFVMLWALYVLTFGGIFVIAFGMMLEFPGFLMDGGYLHRLKEKKEKVSGGAREYSTA